MEEPTEGYKTDVTGIPDLGASTEFTIVDFLFPNILFIESTGIFYAVPDTEVGTEGTKLPVVIFMFPLIFDDIVFVVVIVLDFT